MENKVLVQELENRGIETVGQLIDAIEAGSKVAKTNLKNYKDKIEGLILLIAVEQQ